MLDHVVDILVRDTQNCTISNRSLHDKFHFKRYTIDKVGKEPGMSRDKFNLDQANVFNNVNR